jgi:hypothetical protein
MTTIYKNPFKRLEIFLNEYQPQLEKALNAIQVVKSSDPDSEEFSLFYDTRTLFGRNGRSD